MGCTRSVVDAFSVHVGVGAYLKFTSNINLCELYC